MRRILLLTIAILILVAGQAPARNFTARDFDPADTENEVTAERYREAVFELMDELKVPAIDEYGVVQFSVMPFPMELVALITQWQIHEWGITDPMELSDLIEAANYNKPTVNSFPFVLDGETEWVTKIVAMYYIRDIDFPHPERVPVVWNSEVEGNVEGTTVSEWIVMIEDTDMLEEFLEADSVYLVVGETDGSEEYIELDCGFWRSWGLFDLRQDEAPVEDEQ